MISKLKRIFGIKRFPPFSYIIIIPLFIPVYIIYYSFLLIYLFFYWFLGFWKCDDCNRTYWIKDEKHNRAGQYIGEGCYEKIVYCDACKTERKLTNKGD